MEDTYLTEVRLDERKKEQLNHEKKNESLRVKFNTQFTNLVSPTKPPDKDELDDRKNRNWKKILDKISFIPETDDYYLRCPIKPAFGFWKALALGKYPIENLGINIPETYIALDSNHFIYTDTETGRIIRQADAAYTEFEQFLEKKYSPLNEFLEKKLTDLPGTKPEVPFVITRGTGASDWLGSKFVSSLRALKETRRYAIDANNLMQRFIIPKGFQACIFRLVFHTSNCKYAKGNYAYRIKNKKIIFEANPKKSLVNKTTINTEQAHSFDITLVTGASLKEFEMQSEAAVYFLERSFNIRIGKIVVDFITDFEGINWLINVKALEFEDVIPINIGLEEGDGKVSLDKLTCSVYCKLCGLIFKKDDATKTLTYKLLWELLQHLKKRGIHLNGITVSHNSTRPCRVCNVCYMLVVSEHELIDVEQKFAKAQNIPIADECIRVPVDQKPKHRPALLNEKLYQWRLLFNFTHVTDFDLSHDSFDVKNTYLQYKFFNHKTAFRFQIIKEDKQQGLVDSSVLGTTNDAKLNQTASYYDNRITRKKKFLQPGTYGINAIRVHYFFSETTDIYNFLDKTQLEIKVTIGKEWSDSIAEGTSSTLQYFKKNYTGGQKHQIRILCFFEDGKYCTIKGLVGLVCDGIVDTATMNLYKHNNIYLPDEGFYNSNPFPMEWLEMFEKEDVLMEEYIQETLQDRPKEQTYSPKCSTRDIEKMIDPIESKSKGHFASIESRIPKRSFSARQLTQSRLGSQMQQEKANIATGAMHEAGGNYKFSLLTENANNNMKSNGSLPNKLTKTRPVSGFIKTLDKKGSILDYSNNDKGPDLIDKEIELLNNLTRTKDKEKQQIGNNNIQSRKKLMKKEYGDILGAHDKIQMLEANMKAIDEDDIVKKYLEENSKESDIINKYLYEEDKPKRAKDTNSINNNNKINTEKEFILPDTADAPSGIQIGHNEFADFLDQQKKKMASSKENQTKGSSKYMGSDDEDGKALTSN